MQVFENYVYQNKAPFIPHSHYDWWWPGDAKIQGISSHSTDTILRNLLKGFTLKVTLYIDK